jgi:hypothetical protein
MLGPLGGIEQQVENAQPLAQFGAREGQAGGARRSPFSPFPSRYPQRLQNRQLLLGEGIGLGKKGKGAERGEGRN